MRLKTYFFISAFLVAIIFYCSCHPIHGFMESNFILAKESRLPKWLPLSPEQPRNNLDVEIFFYSHPLYSRAQIIVYGPSPKHEKLLTKLGTYRWHPLSNQKVAASKPEENSYNITFPSYTIITVDGIDEIFEQRQKDNVLYVVDGPKVGMPE